MISAVSLPTLAVRFSASRLVKSIVPAGNGVIMFGA